MITSHSSLADIVLQNKFRWLWHILFWIFIYLDEFFALFGITPPLEDPLPVVIGLIIDIIVVYFNLYFLLPKFLMQKKFGIYILATTASLLLILLYNYIQYADDCYECLLSDNIQNFVHNAFIIGLAVAIKMVKDNFQTRMSLEKVSSEKLKTELGFLKNQVNPHFLFNVLNGFYIQAKKKDEQLPDAILSLSDILRYQIYETRKEFVSVVNEFEYLKNYLHLEQNRRDNLKLEISDHHLTNQAKIAPLLLLPLVENAVKYSQTTDGSESSIKLTLKVVDGKIEFNLINTKGKVDEIRSPDSGIGLDNIQKRLDLIYPEDYVFDIQDSDDIYHVCLILGAK